MTCARPAAAVWLTAAACALALAPRARADSEFSFSATLESQYRLRGIALSNDEPDVRLGFSYDHASGAYLGAAFIGGKTVDAEFHGLGFLAYLGYAQGSAGGLTWDVGATLSEINLYLRPLVYARAAAYASAAPLSTTPQQPAYTGSPGEAAPGTVHYRADYSEIYGGLSWRGTSVHLYASPDYLGQPLRTLYLDFTQTVRPVAHVRLFGHAGLLTPVDGSGSPGSAREHYDVSVGAAYEFLHAEIQLAWADISPEVQYPTGYAQKRSVIIASVTAFF
jgi:hypothetical protein